MSKILCKRQILWLNMSESFDSQDKKDKHDPQQNVFTAAARRAAVVIMSRSLSVCVCICVSVYLCMSVVTSIFV